MAAYLAEFKTINVVLSIQKFQADQLSSTGLISTEKVKELNAHIERVEHKTILRKALPQARTTAMCMKEIRTGDGWMSLDWFSSQKTYEACLKVCERAKVSAQNCPCNQLFKGK